MVGIHEIALVLGLGLSPMPCDDAKTSTFISKVAAGDKVGEIVKISADSVTIKSQEVVGSGGKGKPPKTEMKEHTYPIEEKAKVHYLPASNLTLPKIEEVPVGEKVDLHFVNVKSKTADNKIEYTLTVSKIDVHPPKASAKKDDAKKDDAK